MGSRVEKVGQNVERAAEVERQGIEQGEKDASEIREIKSILDGMDKDVDEDIVEAMDATREAAKGEGIDHMNSEVHGTLEEGYEVANEAINEGSEQAAKSRQAAADFSSISGVSEFGSGTAESSSAGAESIAEQFDGHVETAQQGIEDSEDRFKELEDDILG